MRAGETDALIVLGQTGHGKTVFLASLAATWLEGQSRAGRLEFLSDSDEKLLRQLDQVLAIPEPGRRTTAQMVSMIVHSIEEGEAIEGTKEPENFYVQWYLAEDEDLRRGQLLTLRDVPGHVFEEGVRWEQRGERFGEFLDGALGLFLVIDLHETVSRARESRFSEIIQRYVHALRAVEASAKRSGIRRLPVALLFSRADLEEFNWSVAELAELDALRPLFAALEEGRRRLVTHVDIVSCLRSAQPEGETDRQVLRNVADFFARHLLESFRDRLRARRRRLIVACAALLVLFYIGWCAWGAWRLGSIPARPQELGDLRRAAEQLVDGAEALRHWRTLPWWPGKDAASAEARLSALAGRLAELLREHPAMTEAPAAIGRTRVEYETALRGLKVLAGQAPAQLRASLGAQGGSERVDLLRAKVAIARLPGPIDEHLYAWERAWSTCPLEELRRTLAGRIEPVLAQALDALELHSAREDLDEESADLLALHAFEEEHSELAAGLVRARLATEWEHLRFLFERRREQGEIPTGDLLAELVHLWDQLWHPLEDPVSRGIAREVGRTFAAGVAIRDRRALARELRSEDARGELRAALFRALPSVYASEIIAWNGAEGRAWLVARVQGLGDLLALLGSAFENQPEAHAALDELSAHLRTLAHGKIGPYQFWVVRLDFDRGDELWWERLRIDDDAGEFREWNEAGGVAKPNFRFFFTGSGDKPFGQGWLEPGKDGWEALMPRWEGRAYVCHPFDYEAGRGIEAIFSDVGAEGFPRQDWFTCDLLSVAGAFAPERLQGKLWRVSRVRAAGGKAGTHKGAKRELEAAHQVLEVRIEVTFKGRPLREGGAAFDFGKWDGALGRPSLEPGDRPR